jgi:DNA-binding CsgD family transcriptional regulator
VVGGRGGGEQGADLLLALLGSPFPATTTEEATTALTRFEENGGLVVIRESCRLDDASARALTRGILHRGAAPVVIAAHQEDLGEAFADLERAGLIHRHAVLPYSVEDTGGALSIALGLRPSIDLVLRVHTLTGGHPHLLDHLVRAAHRSGLLENRIGGWTLTWDEGVLRRELLREMPSLRPVLDDEARTALTWVCMARTLSTEQVSATLSSRTVRGLERAGLLTRHVARDPQRTLLRLGPDLLGWVAEASMAPVELAAAWYDFAQRQGDRIEDPATLCGIEAWRCLVEGEIETDRGIALATRALVTGDLLWADRLLTAVSATEARHRGEIAVLRARMAFYEGRAGDALGGLASSLHEVFTGHGSAGPGQMGALLTLHIGLFHRRRAFELLASAADAADEHAASARPGESADREVIAHALRTARREGLTLLPDVVELVLERRYEQARALTASRALDVDLAEESVARLWVGVSLGMSEAQEIGRQELSSLLDDLQREGGLPSIAETVFAQLQLLTMVVGWRSDQLHVRNRGGGEGNLRQPGLAAIQHLVLATLAMQDDDWYGAHRYSVLAAEVTRSHDPFAVHGTALALVTATASYLPEPIDLPRLGDPHEALRRRDPGEEFVHLRLVAEGMALVGSGPPTQEVSQRITEIAMRAHEIGEHGQEQTLMLLAVMGGSPTAIQLASAAHGSFSSGRGGIVGLVAHTLELGESDEDERQALDTVEKLLGTGGRYLAYTVLTNRWQRAEASAAGPSRRLIDLVLRAHAADSHGSWILSTFAPELTLNAREQTVVDGLRDGLTTATIAGRLHLSPRTIEGIISRLLRRFRCANRLELVRLLTDENGSEQGGPAQD